MILPISNEDFVLKCCDSAMQSVDVSGINKTLCMTIQKSSDLKVNGKSAILKIIINVTAATGTIKTSLIDGSSVTFVSAVGTINGSSQNFKNDGSPLCLCDSNINNLSAASYTGNGAIGDFVVTGTNSSSGVTVIDKCKIWIGSAGQNDVKCD